MPSTITRNGPIQFPFAQTFRNFASTRQAIYGLSSPRDGLRRFDFYFGVWQPATGDEELGLSVARFGIEFDDAWGDTLISPERHRAQRFSFVAGIKLTAIDTEAHITAHTEDLSVFGCFVETATPFEEGTRIRLRISHKGVIFTAQGKVAYARPNAGMGIAFTSIEPSGVSILDAWLTELRNL